MPARGYPRAGIFVLAVELQANMPRRIAATIDVTR
jgi:hypothetical protein